MSQSSRREYLQTMRIRYAASKSRSDKSRIIDEVVANLGYHRKYAISVLQPGRSPRPRPIKRPRARSYNEALPAIRLAWEALDYPCAERLHPVLPRVVEQLATHGEIYLDDRIREQLGRISRSTLARRISTFPRVKITRIVGTAKARNRIRSEVPTGRFDYTETRVGALEIDLVEHNGGSSAGHYAYTLNAVDVVSGYSRRQAVLGRGQAGVFRALAKIVDKSPFEVWGLHSDNGSEFLNGHLLRYTRKHKLTFHRGRPYRKNDQPYVEQKNRQFVRELVGYERYDTQGDVEWLNQVYDLFDPYANMFLPMRKLVEKTREGGKVRKRYDEAMAPVDRLILAGALTGERLESLQGQQRHVNPIAVHRLIENLISQGPPPASVAAATDADRSPVSTTRGAEERVC